MNLLASPKEVRILVDDAPLSSMGSCSPNNSVDAKKTFGLSLRSNSAVTRNSTNNGRSIRPSSSGIGKKFEKIPA